MGQEARLAREVLMLEALAQLVNRHAGRRGALLPHAAAPGAVRRARDIVHARYADALPVAELAGAVGLNGAT